MQYNILDIFIYSVKPLLCKEDALNCLDLDDYGVQLIEALNPRMVFPSVFSRLFCHLLSIFYMFSLPLNFSLVCFDTKLCGFFISALLYWLKLHVNDMSDCLLEIHIHGDEVSALKPFISLI